MFIRIAVFPGLFYGIDTEPSRIGFSLGLVVTKGGPAKN